MERIQRELRNVKVQEIAGRTHMAIGVEQPDSLAAAIREFLLAPHPTIRTIWYRRAAGLTGPLPILQTGGTSSQCPLT